MEGTQKRGRVGIAQVFIVGIVTAAAQGLLDGFAAHAVNSPRRRIVLGRDLKAAVSKRRSDGS